MYREQTDLASAMHAKNNNGNDNSWKMMPNLDRIKDRENKYGTNMAHYKI